MRRSILCLALPLLAVGCGTSVDWVTRGKEHYARGEFYQAFYCLHAARAEGVGGDELEKLYWPFRTAYFLKRAQRRVFENDDELALEDLAMVLAIDPENRIARLWQRKALAKLAGVAAQRGDTALSSGNFELALREYHKSLSFVPSFPMGEEGLLKVSKHASELQGKARERYLQGVRALADELFAQTKYHMLIALDDDPNLGPAETSKAEAQSRLDELRFNRAREMEQAGHYDAALGEYQRVLESDENFPEAAERVVFVEREVEAEKLALQGEMALFRGEYAEARKLIDQAFEISAAERPRYNDMLILAREREFGDKYVVAKDVELQGDLETAVVRYREIDEEMPSFLDVKARITDLQASIDVATESYDAGVAAEQAGEVEKAIEHFSDAKLHYPKFRDLDERLARLRDQRGS